MLVLSRRVGEEIVIANDIHLKVLSIKGKQARLGFTAPRSVSVIRVEQLEERRPGPLRELLGNGEKRQAQ